jgi:hypothetical protein
MLSEQGFYGIAQKIQESRSIVFLIGRNAFRGEDTSKWFGSAASAVLMNPLVLRVTPRWLMEQLLDDFIRVDQIRRQAGITDLHDLVKRCVDEGKKVHIITDSCSDSILSFGASIENVIFLRGSVKEVLEDNTPFKFVASTFHQERMTRATSLVRTFGDDTLFVCIEIGDNVFTPIRSNIFQSCNQVYIGSVTPLVPQEYTNFVVEDPNIICSEIEKKISSFV